jgi:hypothetical protein
MYPWYGGFRVPEIKSVEQLQNREKHQKKVEGRETTGARMAIYQRIA